MPQQPTPYNNWGRPPTTRQLREAGLLINAIPGGPSPVSEQGKKMGSVQGFYDLQNNKDQYGNLRPTVPRYVPQSMYDMPSGSTAANVYRQNEEGHSWPQQGKNWTNSATGWTDISRPATAFEEASLPPPVRPQFPSTYADRTGPRERTIHNWGSDPNTQVYRPWFPSKLGWQQSRKPLFPSASSRVNNPSWGGAPIARRAEGGPLATGQISLVGEDGPEIIVPKQPVEVIPLQGQNQLGTPPEFQAPIQEPEPQVPATRAPIPQPYEPMPAAESQRFNPTVDMPPTPPTPVDRAPVSFGDPNVQLLRGPAPLPRDYTHGPRYGAVLPQPSAFDEPGYVPPPNGSREEFEQLQNQHQRAPHLSSRLQDYYASFFAHRDERDRRAEMEFDQRKFDTTQANIFQRQQLGFQNTANMKKQAADEKKAAEEKAYNDDMEYIGKAREIGDFTLEEAEKIAAIKNPILRRSEIKVMEAEKRAIAEERRKQQTNTQEKRAKIAALSEIVRQASDDIKKYRENVTNADGTLGDKNPNADPEAKTKAWERYHAAVLKMIEAGAPAFATVQEADAAKLPVGTIVVVDGRPATIK